MNDLCPVCTIHPGVNSANHLQCIQIANLAPADPRQSSDEFWRNKATLWRVEEGEARTQLCMNCKHYDDSPENQKCI